MLGAATGGSLRGPNLRFVYGLYIFSCVLGDGKSARPRDAFSSAELVGTHVKDQTGLGGSDSLKKLKITSPIGRPAQNNLEFRKIPKTGEGGGGAGMPRPPEQQQQQQ